MTSAASSVTPIATASTTPFSPAVARSGMAMSDCMEWRAPSPAAASATPSTPPSSASRTASERNSATITPRLAPSARRTTSSCCRSSARTRKRLATFAHDTSSRNAAAPNTTHNVRPMLPTMVSRSERTSTRMWEIACGCVERDARAHACDGVKVERRGARLRRVNANGNPECGTTVGEGESRGHDAHDFMLHAIDHDCATDDAGVGCVLPVPEMFAKDHDGWRAGPVFILPERPSHERRNAEHTEQARAGACGFHALGARAVAGAGGAEVHGAGAIGAHTGEDVIGLAIVEIGGVGLIHVADAVHDQAVRDIHELRRIPEGKGAKQHAVHETEDCGRGANAEHQGERGRTGEDGCTHQAARGAANVASRSLDQGNRAPAVKG